jgi:hypothetical protein
VSILQLNANSNFQFDVYVSVDCKNAIEAVKTAYENFRLQGQRNSYFFAINDLHSKLFSDSDVYMHQDVFLREAENVLEGKGRLRICGCF